MSAIMADQSSNNVAEFFTPGPGERLRAARLSKGLDLAKIASELHLTRAVVESLEADDYSDIGARVFVRGYLRNYARIVDMSVESILRQFDEKWPDDGGPSTVVRQSPKLPADGGPSRGWAGAVTWMLIVGTVVLFLVWWRGYLDEIVPEQIRSSSLAERQAVPGAAPVDDNGATLTLDAEPPLDEGALNLPEVALDLPADLAAATSGESATDPTLDASSGDAPPVEAAQPAAAGAAAAIESTTLSAPPAAAGPREAAVAAAVDARPADGGAPVVEGTKQIVMTFTGACWVDVRDSERRFKLFGEMPKGARKVLGGQPPYKMVIGNAKAVTITVNGRPFDLTPYAKGNVARFTLDP